MKMEMSLDSYLRLRLYFPVSSLILERSHVKELDLVDTKIIDTKLTLVVVSSHYYFGNNKTRAKHSKITSKLKELKELKSCKRVIATVKCKIFMRSHSVFKFLIEIALDCLGLKALAKVSISDRYPVHIYYLLSSGKRDSDPGRDGGAVMADTVSHPSHDVSDTAPGAPGQLNEPPARLDGGRVPHLGVRIPQVFFENTRVPSSAQVKIRQFEVLLSVLDLRKLLSPHGTPGVKTDRIIGVLNGVLNVETRVDSDSGPRPGIDALIGCQNTLTLPGAGARADATECTVQGAVTFDIKHNLPAAESGRSQGRSSLKIHTFDDADITESGRYSDSAMRGRLVTARPGYTGQKFATKSPASGLLNATVERRREIVVSLETVLFRIISSSRREAWTK